MKSYGIDTIDDLKDKANGLLLLLGSTKTLLDRKSNKILSRLQN